MKSGGIEASLIIETYTYSENPDIQLLRETVRAAGRIRQENPLGREILLADMRGNSDVPALLEEFPEVRRIDVAGLGFQRLVWCPRWTPASRSSLMLITAITTPLATASGYHVSLFPRYLNSNASFELPSTPARNYGRMGQFEGLGVIRPVTDLR